ncbi:MAG TPA: enolase C-terminal domain-like protein, partial [Terriglobales bacterium]|nr:enolase C-terminal domain-like protein [Terriglobales bacterium]
MKIKDAKVFVCSPGRNFVTLKIYTDEGICGIGDCTLNGRELAAASYLTDHVIPCIVGRDPFQTEDIWQYLYRGAYWRKGPVTMSAIAAVDMALWDIKGKSLNTPLYNLLGGKSRTGVTVYGHANGRDIEETSDEVGRYIEQGYLAVRAQSGVPGLPTTYGVSDDKMFYEPAAKGLPPENVWSTEKYLMQVPKLFKVLRVKYGDEIHLLHDSHHRLTPIEAARLGKELEPYHLFWLEDPVA